jgi:methionyl-tRNA synthetase
LTPFLPSSSSKVHAMVRGDSTWAAMPELVEVDEPTAAGSPSYSVLTGDYETGARWASTPIEVGRPLDAPTPIFAKLDPSVVDEELARLAGD